MNAERYWEGRWRDEAAENERLRAELANTEKVSNVSLAQRGRDWDEIERLRLQPHELHSLREMVIYARSIAQTFPDKPGSTFSIKLRAHAQIIEDMLERLNESHV